MFISFDADRPSSSAFVERVWSCHSTSGGNFLAVASTHWELVVTRLAGDTIVYLGRGGQAVLVKAGPKFEIVGSAVLEGGRGIFNASPAIAQGRLYIRSNRNLYCIGAK